MIKLKNLAKKQVKMKIKSEFVKENYIQTMIGIRQKFKDDFNKLYFTKIEINGEYSIVNYNGKEKVIDTVGLWLFGLPTYKANLKVFAENGEFYLGWAINLNGKLVEALKTFCEE